MERLQRIMASRGVASRRRAEELIQAGRVSVDGSVVSELGTKVDPRSSQIQVDGKLLRAQAPRYLLLYKPRGYITTVSDERDRRTVMDLVKVPERVYPVGRLDRATEGLLLLTNDGDVANRVMHPRYGLAKEYHVLTLSRPGEPQLQRIRNGLVIEGKRIVPEECRILRETHDGLILKIVLHEGMFHIVRRMMDLVGIPVTRLRRVRVGPLTLQHLQVGEWRDLTAGEVNNLYEALHLDEDPVAAFESDLTGVVEPASQGTKAKPRRKKRTGFQKPGADRDRPQRTAPPPPGDPRRPRPAAGGRKDDRPEHKRSSSPGEATRRLERDDRQPPRVSRVPSGDRQRQSDDRSGSRASRAPADIRQHQPDERSPRVGRVDTPRAEPPKARRRRGEPPAPRPRSPRPHDTAPRRGAPTSGPPGRHPSRRGEERDQGRPRPGRPGKQASGDRPVDGSKQRDEAGQQNGGSQPGRRDRRTGGGGKNDRRARPRRPSRSDAV